MLVLDNYIYCKKKALDKDTCINLIELLEESNPQLSDHNYYGIYPDIRNFDYLVPILQNALEEYGKKHPYLGRRMVEFNIDNRFHIQKYLVGACYDQSYDPNYWLGHCEHIVQRPLRILAWMFYLNDIKNKGGTCWPQQKFTSTPRVGDLYIWPAGWTHSHYGIPAPKEEKYIITGWCSLLR